MQTFVMIKLRKCDAALRMLFSGRKIGTSASGQGVAICVYCKSTPIRAKRVLFCLRALLLLAALLAGCSANPNARKLKYLHQGDLYLKG